MFDAWRRRAHELRLDVSRPPVVTEAVCLTAGRRRAGSCQRSSCDVDDEEDEMKMVWSTVLAAALIAAMFVS